MRYGPGAAASRANKVDAQKIAVQYHVDHYAEAPRQHARALRSLGVPVAKIRALHVRTTGAAKGASTVGAAAGRLAPKQTEGQRLAKQESDATKARFKSDIAARARVAQRAGLPGGPHGFGERFVGDLITAAVYSPVGMVRAGGALKGDIGSTIHGKPTLRRSGKIAKAVGTGIKQDFQHPLRHPGFTALDISGLASAGVGTGARIGAAGRAIAAGESVGRALTKRTSEGGSVLHRPPAGRRTYQLNGLKAEVPNSRNPLIRAGQKAHARALNARPESRALAKRVGGALQAERRVTEPAARAGAAATAHRGRRLSTPQQTALRVVAEGQPIAERIRFHQEQAAKAKLGSRELLQHRNEVALLTAARRYVHNVNGAPELRPEFPRLHAAYAAAGKSAGRRTKIMGELGMEPTQLEGRVQGPGRVIGGAKYEKPTPGKLGKPSPALKRSRQRVGTLQRRFDKALGTAIQEEQRARPRTRQQAVEFVANVDRRYAKLIDTMASTHVKPAGVVARRNARNAKLERRGWPTKPTLTHEARLHAERQLGELLRTSKHPTAERLRTDLAEADRLRELLTNQGDTLLGEHKPGRPNYGKAPRPVEYQSVSPRIPRLGGALSMAKEELQQQERAAAKRMKPTGLVGAEDFQGGKFRVPYTAESAPKAQATAAGFRGGLPRKPGSMTHAFTGALLRTANFRRDTTRLTAESEVEAQRYADLLRLRDRVIKGARKQPREGDIAIRLEPLKGKPMPGNVKAALRKVDEGIKLTRDEQTELHGFEQTLHDELFPKNIDPLEYAQHKDVRWLDPKVLGDLAQPRTVLAPGARRAVGVLDAINNAQKMAILYLKPAYAVPNIAGNAFLTLVHQGFAAAPNLTRSARVNAKLSEEAAATLDSVMGEGLARSLSTGKGAGAKLVERAAEFWSKGVDAPFRRSAFLHEARLLGYREWADVERLLMDPKHEGDLLEVSQRANKALIDYADLQPWERDIARRVIFFYPWVKGATKWAGHFATEHPIEAAGVAQLGRYGKEHTGLGPVPSYLEGSFKVGNKLVNPASAQVLGTPAQVVEAAQGLRHGQFRDVGALSDFLTPGLRLAGAEAFRVNPSGGYKFPASAGAGDIALDVLGKGLPQYRLGKAIADRNTDTSKRLFPIKGWGDIVKPFTLGGVAGRSYNPTKLQAEARAEQRALMSPADRVKDSFRVFHGQVDQAIKAQSGVISDPRHAREWISGRLALRFDRARARAKYGSSPTAQQKYEADAKLILQHGWASADKVRKAIRWSRTATSRDISNRLRLLTTHYFDPDGGLSHAVAYLNEQGALLAEVDAVGKHGELDPSKVRKWLRGDGVGLDDVRAARKYLHEHYKPPKGGWPSLPTLTLP